MRGSLSRAALVLGLLGATLGVALDAWHVATGTTWYASPWRFGIAAWTVPLFTAAGVSVGTFPVVVERALGRVVPPPTPGRALAALGLFVGAYLASGVFRGAVCALVLAALVVATYLASGRPPMAHAAAHAAFAALGGALVEILLVHGGAFSYADARLLGVAPWLPLLYACASLALTPLARGLAADAWPSRHPAVGVTARGRRARGGRARASRHRARRGSGSGRGSR